ncbi:SCO3242 family prenyltransferase [Streptomyces violaceusniger]|uniref:UbiA prenyltransferase n=1 Tax=Streptomyces violaceusniger (strain Tu 4113) TaxID=653045 RepID=G2NYQ2_STRV4|nr:UbiA prenyltransferase [Streptomyces violaceusniger Tu 4113]
MTRAAGERGGWGNGGDWAELLRVSALFTVPGDALAGAAAARCGPNRGTALAVCASLCLYEAGMALNDWADRDIDAVERPGRPLPSGRIAPGAALTAATGLTAAGLLCAAAAGRPALATATALAGTVWAYDLGLKNTPAGPPAMAAARALDLLLGATATAPATLRPALPPAALLGAHTLAVTMVSRREAVGGSSAAPLGALAVGTAIAWAATRRPAPASGRGPKAGHRAPLAAANGATTPSRRGTPPGGPTAGGATAALAREFSRAGLRRGSPARRLVAAVVAGRRVAVAAGTGHGGPPGGLGARRGGAARRLVTAATGGGPPGGPRAGAGLPLTVASRGAAAERTRPVSRIAAVAGVGLVGGRAGAAPTRNIGTAALPGAAAGRFAAVAGAVLAGGYVATVARPLAHAALNPSPYFLQRAVGSGIRAMIPLQAVLASRAGAHRTAAGLLALMPVARRLSRKVSAT